MCDDDVEKDEKNIDALALMAISPCPTCRHLLLLGLTAFLPRNRIPATSLPHPNPSSLKGITLDEKLNAKKGKSNQ